MINLSQKNNKTIHDRKKVSEYDQEQWFRMIKIDSVCTKRSDAGEAP